MPQDISFGFRFRRPTPVVGATLIVLVAVWVVTALTFRVAGGGLYEALSLQPGLVFQGRHLWGVVTYALLHSLQDTDHLLFNGLVFYFFAPELEQLWGRSRFLLFMALTALGGAAFFLAAVALGLSQAGALVGFSGVVMGVTVAWGLTYPDREMFLLFFRLKGMHMVYVTIALQLLTALSLNNVSAAAHFGGMAAGALFVVTQTGRLRRWWLERRLRSLQAEKDALRGERVRRGPPLRVIKGGADEPPKDKRYLN